MTTTISGDGSIELGGTSSSQGNVKLFEDTDNGTNYVELKAAANIASNVAFTLPNADGTNGQILQTNGSGALSFTDLPSQPPTGLGTLSNTQTFTSSGTWTKPGAGDWAVVRIWGGGGGGGRGGASNNQVGGGGGGGAMVEKIFKLSDLGATETVTIGAGGTGSNTANTAGANGGNTTFGSHVTAYGGGGGGPGPAGQGGGGGGDASAGQQGGQISGLITGANGGGTTIVAKQAFPVFYQSFNPVATQVRSVGPQDLEQQTSSVPFTPTMYLNNYRDDTGGGVLNETTFITPTSFPFIGGSGGGGNVSSYSSLQALNSTIFGTAFTTQILIQQPAPYGGGSAGQGAGRSDALHQSLWGGAGGACGIPLGANAGALPAYYLGNGANIVGGNGSSNANTAGNGSQPACGGGGSENGASGNGGDGQCIVWVFTA